MFSNTVFVKKEDKEQLIKLATEACKILDEYEDDCSKPTITSLTRSKNLGAEFLMVCSCLPVKEDNTQNSAE